MTTFITEFEAATLARVNVQLQVPNREPVGVLTSLNTNASANTVSRSNKVQVPLAPQVVAQDYTENMALTNPASTALNFAEVALTEFREVPVGITGEDTADLKAGYGEQFLESQSIFQAIRTLGNEANTGAAVYMMANSSRAAGTVGTPNFETAGVYNGSAAAARILNENGVSNSNRYLSLDWGSLENVQSKQISSDWSGNNQLSNNGMYNDMTGFRVAPSGFTGKHVNASAPTSNFTTTSATYSKGDTVITFGSGSTGAVVAGDIVTFAGDDNQYIVKTGSADVSSGGTFTINAPGLMADMAGSVAITVIGEYTPSFAIQQNSALFVNRTPFKPADGDIATVSVNIKDPLSGMFFNVSKYKGKGAATWYVSTAWGFGSIQAENSALLIS